MADEQTPQAIDDATVRIKEHIAAMIETIHEEAGRRRDGGMVLGEGRNRLYTDPLGFEAPKQHPVWADELRHERETLRRMGEAGTEKAAAYNAPSVEWPRATVLERFQEAVNQLPAQARTPEHTRNRVAMVMGVKLIALLAGLLCGLSVATAVFAYAAHLSPALGPPLWHQSILAFYPPWGIVRWAWWWAGRAPRAFQWPLMVGLLVAGLTIVKTWPRAARTTQPQAHWASWAELQTSELCGEEGTGIVVGKRGRRVLRYSGQGHVFAVGSTGSGKTACLISTLLEYRQSVFVHDPKDSLYGKTAGYRGTLGKVVRLAPLNPKTEGYDPLSAVRLDTDDEYPDVATIARFLTNPEGKKTRDDVSEHFQELVNAFFCGVLLYGLKSGIATTLTDINDLVTRIHWPDLLTVMRAFDHPEVQRAAEVVSRIADRELSGVQTTAARALQIFSDPRVARMTSQPTFRLTDLREADTPCTVYYSVPFGDMERLRPLSRLILRQVLGHVTSRLTGWRQRLLMAVDELPSLDRLTILSDALNFAREFGVQLYCLTPSMEEVVSAYGTHHPWLEGTYVQLVYGLLDPDAARRFSRRVGVQKARRIQTTVQHGGRGGSSTSHSDYDAPLFSETHVLENGTGIRPHRGWADDLSSQSSAVLSLTTLESPEWNAGPSPLAGDIRMWFVSLAYAAASVIPIASTINVLVLAVQAAGGGFIALKCLYLGITWRRGHEHGMDEFSALGIAAALIVGATAIGAAVGGSAGTPLIDTQALHRLNEDLGDIVGASLYLAALLVPGGRVWRWLRREQ